MEEKIKVYVKINSDNYIVAVASSIFIEDLKGWVFIDEGYGDKYAHAQSQYFDKPLISEDGKYNYKYENNEIIYVGE